MFEGVLTCKQAAGVGTSLCKEADVRPVGVDVDFFILDFPNSRNGKGRGHKHEPCRQLLPALVSGS